MSLHLKPETRARLEAAAAAHGLSADDYLEVLVEREVLLDTSENTPLEPVSGMVEEDGLHVYRTGKPLPKALIDGAIRRAREERTMRLLGNLP